MKKAKPIILRIVAIIGKIILGVFLLIGIILLTIGFMYLIGNIQEAMFLPEAYILWVFKYPFSSIVFIYELYFIIGFFYALSKYFREGINAKISSLKRYRAKIFIAFIAFNVLLLYMILFNVTVITGSKIIDYTFLSPQGKEYEYRDIIKIDTGIYGRKKLSTFAHYSRGDFYYIIQLMDGTKIDLMDVAGVTDETYTDTHDPRFILEKLDKKLVDMGIPKQSSMENFEYCTENLDKLYTDKIRNILLNRP